MERFIGLDVHAASSTLAVMGPSGRRLKSLVVETNAKALVDAVRSIGGQRLLCMEEGTQSEWLYEVLSPHVAELVVAGMGSQRSYGHKSDRHDAFDLAEALRTGVRGAGESGHAPLPAAAQLGQGRGAAPSPKPLRLPWSGDAASDAFPGVPVPAFPPRPKSG